MAEVGVGEFGAAVDRLIGQVGHWEAPRWSAGDVGQTPADQTYAVVQRLADLGADAEGRARRPVPRLADTVLPDQVRVVADDLLAATPPAQTLQSAEAEVNALRRSLDS